MLTFRKNSFDYSSVLDLVVNMRPIDVRAGPLKSANRRRSSIVSKPPDSICAICLENVSFLPHIHCLECKRTSVSVCVPCFQLGAELGEHRRGHNYEVIYRCGPPVFTSAPNEGPQWGVLEEQRLLSLIRAYKIDDWPKIALAEFGRIRTVDEAMNHFNRCFLSGPISEIVLEGMIRPPIHAFGLADPEIYSGEFFKPVSVETIKAQIKESLEKLPNANQLMHTVEYNELAAIRPVKLANELVDEQFENMICEFSHIHVEHSNYMPQHLPFNYPRCFVHDRLTHLHKSPRLNGRLPNHKHSSSSSKNKVLALKTNLFDEEDEQEFMFSRAPLDNNLDIEDQTPTPGSPTNRYALREKHQRNSTMSNGVSKINDESVSPPSSPRTRNHKTPKCPEKKEDVDMEDENARSSRDRKRHRDTLSYSPPKNRRSSIVRKKKKRVGAFNSNRRIAKAKRRTLPTVSSPRTPTQNGSNARRLPKKPQRQLESTYFSKEELMALRLTHPSLNFTHREAPLLTKQQIKKLDSDDLGLVAYNNKRDDFEHEYRNAAEHFISKIFLNGECLIASELEQFKNAVRVARVHRYNRILQRRFANHAIIRDHQLLNEFFSIVKTNVNERGKYNIFAADSFPSKKSAEEMRPYFAKLHRVLPNSELNSLAEDVAEIEALMVKIRTLRSLQTTGITEIKGKFKSEIAIASSSLRNRKRKPRRHENELRKATLRWNRIKNWQKQQSN